VAVGRRMPGIRVILWNQSHGSGRAEHLVNTLDVGQVAADILHFHGRYARFW
jgi:hypothetical protein